MLHARLNQRWNDRFLPFPAWGWVWVLVLALLLLLGVVVAVGLFQVVVGALVVLVEITAWVTAGFSVYVAALVLTGLVTGDRRRQTWRRSLWYEYVSSLPRPDDEGSLNSWQQLQPLRRFVVRTKGLRSGDQAERVRHARRWVLASSLWTLTLQLVALAVGVLGIGMLLWLHGLLRSARPVQWADAYWAFAIDTAWNVVHAVPILGDLTDLLGWQRPDLFAGERLWGVVLLCFKVLVFVPLVTYFVEMARQSSTVEPTSAVEDDPAVRTVVELLSYRLEVPVLRVNWSEVFRGAADMLNRHGPLRPEGAWTAADVSDRVRRL